MALRATAEEREDALNLYQTPRIVRDLGPPSAAAIATRGPALNFSDLTWSADGKHLAACRWEELPKQRMQGSIVIATLADDGVRLRTLPGDTPGCEVLGLRGGDWLVKNLNGDSGREEVLAVSAAGRVKRLLQLPTDSLVSAYLADSGAVIEVEGVDDPSDPTRLTLAPLSGAKAKAWLRGVRGLNQLVGPPRSAGGGFVLVTVRQGSGQAGAIDLVSLDGTSVRQVLPAPGEPPGKVWFSEPLPRPLPVARP